MSLQSFGFFGFLLVVAAVYLHLPQRWQSAFLLAASWVFYALAMPSMLPVTIAIAVFTYLCGRGMTAREGARKTAFLRIGVAGLLAILAFFKYNGAFASDGGWQTVAMPLGISFYSFLLISGLITLCVHLSVRRRALARDPKTPAVVPPVRLAKAGRKTALG